MSRENSEDDDEDDSHLDLQEVFDDSEIDSDEEWANDTCAGVPELKVKNLRKNHLKTRIVSLIQLNEMTNDGNRRIKIEKLRPQLLEKGELGL